MIDKFCAKTTSKTLILQNNGFTTLIGEPQKNKKPKLVDVAMGDFQGIKADLQSQGYKIKVIK